MSQGKLKTKGLHHIALFVTHLEKCIQFYTEILGMHVEWQPDEDNVYLSSGSDNLALHRKHGRTAERDQQKLDHIGFILESESAVEDWYLFLKTEHIPITQAPKTHRDGTRSFYCLDPDGNSVQLIYHPQLAKVL